MTLLRTDTRPPEERRTDDMVLIARAGLSVWDRTITILKKLPSHRVTVESFSIDPTPVTNRQFKRFVIATGNKTTAEITPTRKIIPARSHMLYARLAGIRAAEVERSICATEVNGGPS